MAVNVIPHHLLEEFINTGRMTVKAGRRTYLLCELWEHDVMVRRGVSGYCVQARGDQSSRKAWRPIPLYDQLVSFYLALKYNQGYFHKKAVWLG